MKFSVVVVILSLALLLEFLWRSSHWVEERPFVSESPLHHFFEGLEYFDGGAGEQQEVLLVVHGQGQTGRIFHQLDDRSDSVRIIAVSMPGFGQSLPLTDYRKDVALRNMSARFERLLNHLDVERFHVLGYSSGAMVAYRLASNVGPERCLGVASVAGAVWSHQDYSILDDPNVSGALRMTGHMARTPRIFFPMCKYITRHFASAALFMPDDFALLTDNVVAADRLDQDIKRSVATYHHGMMHGLSWLFADCSEELVDWKNLRALPVSIFSFDHDHTVLARSIEFQRRMLPHANVVQFSGGHLHVYPEFGKAVKLFLDHAKSTRKST